MSIIGWFALGAAVAAYLCAWRYFAGRVAWKEKGWRDTPRTDDVIWGLLAGAVLALAAPVLVPYEFLKGRGMWDGLHTFMVRRGLYTPAEFREDLR